MKVWLFWDAQATVASAAAVSIFALAAAAPAAQAATEVMQLAEVSTRNSINQAFRPDTYWPMYWKLPGHS